MNTPLANQKNWLQQGQSIIEVLIATAVVGLVLTSVVVGLTYSIKNTAISTAKTLATKLAQEGMEVYRRERDILGWERFLEAVQSGSGQQTYCLNELPANTQAFMDMVPDSDGCNGELLADQPFTREVLVDTFSSEEVRVEVVVIWQDGATERTVEVVQRFKKSL